MRKSIRFRAKRKMVPKTVPFQAKRTVIRQTVPFQAKRRVIPKTAPFRAKWKAIHGTIRFPDKRPAARGGIPFRGKGLEVCREILFRANPEAVEGCRHSLPEGGKPCQALPGHPPFRDKGLECLGQDRGLECLNRASAPDKFPAARMTKPKPATNHPCSMSKPKRTANNLYPSISAMWISMF